MQGRPEEALAAYREELLKYARLLGTALAYHALGRAADSDAALNALVEQYSDSCAHQIVVILAFRGDIEGAFAWLERAYTQRDHGLQAVLHSVFLNNLRGDPCASLEIGACRLNTPRLGGPSCGPLTIM